MKAPAVGQLRELGVHVEARHLSFFLTLVNLLQLCLFLCNYCKFPPQLHMHVEIVYRKNCLCGKYHIVSSNQPFNITRTYTQTLHLKSTRMLFFCPHKLQMPLCIIYHSCSRSVKSDITVHRLFPYFVLVDVVVFDVYHCNAMPIFFFSYDAD